jgi:hypothetical protein
MTFHSTTSTVRPTFSLSNSTQRPAVPAGILSRRELRRIIAEQLD